MPGTYRINNQNNLYFITSTIVRWVDLFDKKIYIDIVVDSLNYCIEKKGLEVYAWVIMSNHIHLIIGSKTGKLEGIIRDFKKHTSKTIIKLLKNSEYERREWILDIFNEDGLNNPNNLLYQVWQQTYHAKEIFSMEFLLQKLNYIHMNPVRASIVSEPWHYIYSSAVDYKGTKGLVDVILL